jgi:hypothetical protein
MAELLAKVAPKASNRCFTVTQNDAGDWIVRERRGAIVRVSPTQKAAVHFALFELGNRPAAALLTPRNAKPSACCAR